MSGVTNEHLFDYPISRCLLVLRMEHRVNKDSNAVENNDSLPQIFASCVAEDVVNHGREVVAAVLLPGKVPEFLDGYSALSWYLTLK